MLAGVSTLSAETWNGFYLNGNVGMAMSQELSIDSEVTSSAGRLSFSSGVRGDLEFGGRWFNHLDVGIQAGILWNSVDKIQDDSASGSTLFQVPVLLNFTYRHPIKEKWIPYVGAGVGGVYTMLDLQSPVGDMNASDFTLGYQLSAGLRYAFTEKMELGVGYQYLASGDHDWSDSGISLKTDASVNHCFVLSFSWKF